MNEQPYEAALRHALRTAAPGEVPSRLEERVQQIPDSAIPQVRWRAWGRAAVVLVVAAVAMATASSVLRALPFEDGGGGTSYRLIAGSTFGSLAATDLALVINGSRVAVPAADAPGVGKAAFTGSATFGQITLEWEEKGRPYVLVVHLSSNTQTWWVSDAVVSDGRDDGAGWLYFEGPLFETPIGSDFVGSPLMASVRSTFGEAGSMMFGALRLSAFNGIVPRDLAAGTMPPSGVIGTSGPDFIPLVIDTEIVGYVSAHWRDELPVAGFRGQLPDQPVFGRDLRTIVGYFVPGRGFEPSGAR